MYIAKKHIRNNCTKGFFLVAFVCSFILPPTASAQSINATVRDIMSKFSSFGKEGSGPDTTRARPPNEDSIMIIYYNHFSPYPKNLQSNMVEQNSDMIVWPLSVHLGNLGTATKTLYFQPSLYSNLRTNIHTRYPYMWNINNIRFYQTTRPYTKLGYITGPQKEFHYFVRHTQNITPTWNVALNFRLTMGNGFYKNQTTNNSNFYFANNYLSRNERIRFRAAYIINDLFSQENGGILFETPNETIEAINDNRAYSRKKQLPVGLGADVTAENDLNNRQVGRSIKTEQAFAEFNYDFVRKKSSYKDTYIKVSPKIKEQIKAAKDSTHLLNDLDELLRTDGVNLEAFDLTADTIPDSVLIERNIIQFVPKLRLGYTYQMDIINHQFNNTLFTQKEDFFLTKYYPNADIDKTRDTLTLQDQLEVHKNQLNVSWFLKPGRTDNYVKLSPSYITFHNPLGKTPMSPDIGLAGELLLDLWNNRIRLHAKGYYTFSGHHKDDYTLDANFQTSFSKIKADLSFKASVVSRSAPYHYTENSNFYISPSKKPTWQKENIVKLSGKLDLHRLNTHIAIHNYTFSNFFFFKDHYNPKQHNGSVNVLQLHAKNKFKFLKFIRYTSDLWLQWASDSSVINIPTLVTLQRLFVEGIAFKKQHVAAGVEFRYALSYYPQSYSSLVGDWVYQNQARVNNLPTINLFIHFRIRGFFFYLRAEQLNTVNIEYDDGAFSYPERNNEIYIWPYPYPSFSLRLGFYWNLIN